MANPAELPSLPQPATSLQPPPPARDPSPRVAPLQPAVAPAEAYDQDIDAYLRSMESAPRCRPAPDYMELYAKLGEPMTPVLRAILVDWLAFLTPTLHIQSRTLHLAVLCLDRFLAAARARPVVGSDRKLIIATAAALFVAYKYETVYRPNVEGLLSETSCVIDGGGCTRDELLAAEAAVLKALRYELGAPTAFTFLEHFLERLSAYGGDRGDSAATQLASYVAELSLLDYDVLRFRPSVVAAAAILVARRTARPSDDNPWGHEHERATGYTAAELKECAERLNRLHRNKAESGEHIRKKYNKDVTRRRPTRRALSQIWKNLTRCSQKFREKACHRARCSLRAISKRLVRKRGLPLETDQILFRTPDNSSISASHSSSSEEEDSGSESR